MTISVIVCAHNEERFVAACLHSLLAQSRRPDEIILINNASDDDTGSIARGIPGVRVVDRNSRTRTSAFTCSAAATRTPERVDGLIPELAA